MPQSVVLADILSRNTKLGIELTRVLSHFWVPPQQMRHSAQTILEKREKGRALETIVSGETDNLTCYILEDDIVTIFTPFADVAQNIVLDEFPQSADVWSRHTATLDVDERICKRLDMPNVVLINPYISERYPVPRLSLNVSILASYLRKYQVAEVSILDTQFGITREGIVQRLAASRPEIIGISFPHGQTRLAMQILDDVCANREQMTPTADLVIGNFIAASFPQAFWSRHPDILVCTGEGEPTLRALCEFRRGARSLGQVPNLAYLENGTPRFTDRQSVDMDDLPPPALDSLEDLISHRGALTHEWSRGCFWKCTFCPREHKPDSWKGMSPGVVIDQWRYFDKVINRFDLSRRIYVADEETVGGDDEFQTARILEIALRLREEKLHLGFDSYARADQVFNRHQSREWHTSRIRMWRELQRAGLSRLFIGIESGSKIQLARYGKGIRPTESIMAIRILSALGIEFRFGFIMFDPLVNLDELLENISFLERRDAFLKPIYDRVVDDGKVLDLAMDEEMVRQQSENIPIYSAVSYMLASLEVLARSSYIQVLRAAERKYRRKLFFEDIVDLSIGRHKIRYLDQRIGSIADHCQLWIDRNFAFMYTVKSLCKVASPEQRSILLGWMVRHRELSHFLLKSMLYCAFGPDRVGFSARDCVPPETSDTTLNGISRIAALRGNVHPIDNERQRRCLSLYELLMRSIVGEARDSLEKGMISDTIDGDLKRTTEQWVSATGTWTLLNPI